MGCFGGSTTRSAVAQRHQLLAVVDVQGQITEPNVLEGVLQPDLREGVGSGASISRSLGLFCNRV